MTLLHTCTFRGSQTGKKEKRRINPVITCAITLERIGPGKMAPRRRRVLFLATWRTGAHI